MLNTFYFYFLDKENGINNSLQTMFLGPGGSKWQSLDDNPSFLRLASQSPSRDLI